VAEEYRFLLDEHMMPLEGLPLDTLGFELIPLGEYNPALVSKKTPDWMLYLEARRARMTGLITHETRQLNQDLEARALEVADIVLISFKKGMPDEITKWGLLMAYSRRIVDVLRAGERGSIELPSPGVLSATKAADFVAKRSQGLKISGHQMRDQADKEMKARLAAAKKEKIWPV
jgi:hypothetical protein